MDEIELRIAALELALIEVAAHLDRAHLEAALEAIRDGIPIALDGDELAIRRGAIQLLEDALGRYEDFTGGLHWRG